MRSCNLQIDSYFPSRIISHGSRIVMMRPNWSRISKESICRSFSIAFFPGPPEVAKAGVTVNAVCPGYVQTPMTDETVDRIMEISLVRACPEREPRDAFPEERDLSESCTRRERTLKPPKP